MTDGPGSEPAASGPTPAAPAATAPPGAAPAGTSRGITAPGITAPVASAWSRHARRAGRILRRLGYGVAGLAVLLVSGLLPVQSVRIPSDSMTPTIQPGDHLLLDKRNPDAVALGDVVVVHDPHGDGLLVKRVIAVGGDSIGFEDGVLVRNGLPVTEPYTDDFLDGVYYGPDTVPPGSIYLLGDNRGDSVDSRDFGSVPVSSVVGRIAGRVFPSPGAL